MKQVLAVLAAVALIGGAWFVRTEFIAPTDDTGGTTQVDDVAEEPATGLDVVCDELLGDACPAGSTRRDSADLVEAFSIPEVPHDVLVAPAIVVQMIEESGRSSATLSEERPTVATTPIVLVVAAGRDAEVTACGTTWTCASTLVTAGDLRPAFADPADETAASPAWPRSPGATSVRPVIRSAVAASTRVGSSAGSTPCSARAPRHLRL